MTFPQKQHTEPIVEILDQVRQQTGYGRARVFRDWTRIIFVSLQRDDVTHNEIVDGYNSDFGEETGRAAIEAYSEGFAELLMAMKDTEADLLGFLFQRYGAASEQDGQFFTLPNAAQFAASVTLPDSDDISDSTPDNPIRINDPTCGSGTLLVDAGQRLEKIANSPYSALFYGQDIDRTCVEMTAINFVIRGLPGCVIHGDSLGMEPTAAWKIMPSKGLMGEPIRECEPPTFASGGDNTSPTGAATFASENDEAPKEEVEVDVKMGQQTQFSAFTDGSSGNR